MPQSSRTMVTFLASFSHRAGSPLWNAKQVEAAAKMKMRSLLFMELLSSSLVYVYLPPEGKLKLHLFVLRASLCAAADLNCDLKDYKPIDGLTAELRGETLDVAWSGERGEQLRAGFVIRDGQPIVSDLEARKNSGKSGNARRGSCAGVRGRQRPASLVGTAAGACVPWVSR